MAIRRIIPRTHQKQAPDISLAIVNIVLLLIFFFLITGRMTNAPSFAIELSETAELPVEHLPKPILIFEPGDVMSLDGEVIEPDALADAVADYTALNLLIDRNENAHTLLDILGKPEFDHLDIRLVTIHRSGEP
jgi:biopolymer transport protein ExbD